MQQIWIHHKCDGKRWKWWRDESIRNNSKKVLILSKQVFIKDLKWCAIQKSPIKLRALIRANFQLILINLIKDYLIN